MIHCAARHASADFEPGAFQTVTGLTSITITNKLVCKAVPVVTIPKEPKCDPATTVSKGGKCVCEYRNMVQTSATACACTRGFKFVAGKGCIKPEPQCKQGQRFEPQRGRCEPVCGKGFDYSVKRNACIARQPDCKQGTIFNARSGKCEPVVRECRNGTVRNKRTGKCEEIVKRCDRGQIQVNGRCIDVPRCERGTIPIPGTGKCVKIGRDEPRGDNPRGDRPKADRPRDCKPGPIPGTCG